MPVSVQGPDPDHWRRAACLRRTCISLTSLASINVSYLADLQHLAAGRHARGLFWKTGARLTPQGQEIDC